MTQENIKKLAKEMNVSVHDLKCLAQGVVNSIKKDGIEETFLNETEENKEKISTAYAIHETKKFSKFVTTYITNEEARDTFRKQVLLSI